MSHTVVKDAILVALNDGRFAFLVFGAENNCWPRHYRWIGGYVSTSEIVARAIMLSDEIGLMVRAAPRKAWKASIVRESDLDFDQSESLRKLLSFDKTTLDMAYVRSQIADDLNRAAGCPFDWSGKRARRLSKLIADCA